MNRSQIVAIITGAISILLAIAYLVIVQIIDYRDMKPAPISQLNPPVLNVYNHQTLVGTIFTPISIVENNFPHLHLDIIAKV
ncbi:hypothetical protein [Cuspidothrix issatschenkoi]|uniref:Glucose-inhibited division protein A n=1 Tax=Cuspidothrix issatschenkoi CHARLIE-1 TaxID=2052836 RepID=A0A2S6CRH2_9CYAN|nr:hypothetical protein [Cuspidothrix issatschenkoi]PPJ62292.1 hypothetical protein CUN59_16345 [Cuspidothrix issatschenkoi CHARLIE-1]